MKYLYGLALIGCLVLWSSCRNDFESVPSTGNLEFSRDTVYLDTIFSNIGSSTYNLKVYNRSNDDINIPTVRLGEGEESYYRLNVDGIPGKTFENVQILAKDSIFIFVETTIDINNFPNPDDALLYTDQILFDSAANEQHVDLVTLVQDAVFLYPELDDDGMVGTISLGLDADGNEILIEGFILDDTELNFTNEKPYVIYGYAAVAAGKTLTVQPGARVHFHENSGILVSNTGSMKSIGSPSLDPELLENEIIFEGDRLEPDFSDIPGQWGTIWLTLGSTNNVFEYTTIKNNVVGILMDGNDGDETLTLKNVQIYNTSNVGLLARSSIVYGENLVINNAGQSALACSIGGVYTFNHSTFANYWTSSFRTFPAVQLDNVIDENQGFDLTVRFNNCIIYGNERRELGLFSVPSALFDFKLTNSLFRFEDPNGDFSDDPNYDFNNTDLYSDTVLNVDPIFQDTSFNNFNIESGTSGADGIGLFGIPPAIDLNGIPRSNPPDAGAYESIVFPEGD